MRKLPLFLCIIGTLAAFACLGFSTLSIARVFSGRDVNSSSGTLTAVHADHNDLLASLYPSSYIEHKYHVSSPFNISKWGSYRPDVYFGLKTKSHPSHSTGLLWSYIDLYGKRQTRHEPFQDEVDSFYWNAHNGVDYGRQNIVEKNRAFEIQTEFKVLEPSSPVSFIQRISLNPFSNKLSNNEIYFYLGSECSERTRLPCNNQERFDVKKVEIIDIPSDLDAITTLSSVLVLLQNYNDPNDWKFYVFLVSSSSHASPSISFHGLKDADIWSGTDRIINAIKQQSDVERNRASRRSIFDRNHHFKNDIESDASFFILQVSDSSSSSFTLDAYCLESLHEDISVDGVWETGLKRFGSFFESKNAPFSDSVFSSIRDMMVVAQSRTSQLLSNSLDTFERDFAKKFPHIEEKYKKMSMVALSSLMGGMGAFHGHPEVVQGGDVDSSFYFSSSNPNFSSMSDKQKDSKTISRQEIDLFTGTPSRTMFPRGFLWDEGFHLLAISSWSWPLAMESWTSWLSAQYMVEGGHDRIPSSSLLDYWKSSPTTAAYLTSPLTRHQETGDYILPDSMSSISPSWSDHGVGGWIPREMVLGQTAHRRIPAEFVAQAVQIANPPTFFLVLEKYLKDFHHDDDVDYAVSKRSCSNQPAGAAAADDDDDATTSTTSTTTMGAAGKEECLVDQSSNTPHHDDQLLLFWKFSQQAFPAMESWLHGLFSRQAGPSFLPGSFRWRGRQSSDGKIVPNTLASGLDDYPRSMKASMWEAHVDLLSWMSYASSIMDRWQSLLKAIEDRSLSSIDSSRFHFRDFDYHSSWKSLRQKIQDYHWDEKQQIYSDLGISDRSGRWDQEWVIRCSASPDSSSSSSSSPPSSTVDVGAPLSLWEQKQSMLWKAWEEQEEYQNMRKLLEESAKDDATSVSKEQREHFEQQERNKRQQFAVQSLASFCPSSHPQFQFPLGDGRGGYLSRECWVLSSEYRQDRLEFLSHWGYVNLFPFLLQQIPIDVNDDGSSDRALRAMLRLIQDDLWTPYGLRSMAPRDTFYRRKNSASDEPYWRGPIWMNINYLALRSLRYYSQHSQSLDLQRECGRLYQDLRTNLLHNVHLNYERTHHFWEQYDDQTGQGIRGHPFVGWTALIFNIAAEIY